MLSFSGLIALTLFDGIILISSMFFLFFGLLTAYFALKAERKEAMNGIPDEADKRQIEA